MNQRPIAVTFRATLIATLAAAGLVSGMPLAHAANKPSSKPPAEKTVEAATAPLPANAVARVNNVVITQAQLDDAVRASNAPDTPALRASVKNQLIARELFRQAAEKQHYESRPQVVAAVEQARTVAMTAAYLRDQVKPAPVTEADVKAKYDAIVATLGEFEYKPSAIAVKDADTAQTVLTQLKKGTDFAQLAKQYSQGPGAAQGGALNWISFKTPIQPGTTQNWPQPLAEALVKLPQGGVSSAPVQIGDAFWILRVDEKRATQIPQYDQIKDALRKQLEQLALQKATAQVVVDLMKNARIQQQ
ncbi:UNVERIFIED_ORG: parvulin-like peptidyl-prolyl isomerase [Burkholderia sp. 1595]|uniref:peptidylprolyl isomerase n=1 Tax=Paraburkholderia terricola TaxID=169427 RepID=A0ABU1M2L3_9BURK|nr:peptidyl-prolyl cis-trans isomerase [Paraburkholderia terricola]MDR6413266.1 parvulin-like peptidyl-prolyl isomerase [Paraburkholderia terricola]